jgi:hypothetical protein
VSAFGNGVFFAWFTAREEIGFGSVDIPGDWLFACDTVDGGTGFGAAAIPHDWRQSACSAGTADEVEFDAVRTLVPAEFRIVDSVVDVAGEVVVFGATYVCWLVLGELRIVDSLIEVAGAVALLFPFV